MVPVFADLAESGPFKRLFWIEKESDSFVKKV
jgi:hypothetical protein